MLAQARDELERLGELTGALLATSAPANGLFAGLSYALGISGGFASPFAAQLLPQADVVLVAGASVNHWTTRDGALIGPRAKLAQIDVEARAIGRNHPADLAMLGDAAAGARLLADELERRGHHATGFRTPEMAARSPPTAGSTTRTRTLRPRTGSTRGRSRSRWSERLPADKAVAVDSGHFLGYPSMFLSVPDARAVGVSQWLPGGRAGAGQRHRRRDRPAGPPHGGGIGDGGAFMALAEIETAARLGLKLLVVIYDDNAYGAEVHHFAPMGHDVSRVQFPDADLAAIARAPARRRPSSSPADLYVAGTGRLNRSGCSCSMKVTSPRLDGCPRHSGSVRFHQEAAC